MPEVVRNASVAVTAAQSNVISEAQYGAQRAVISITNLEAVGGNNVFLAWDAEAAANKGMLLVPQQTYIESIDAGYKPSNARICAFSAGNITLAIHERILLRG